jgi:hypothetical protein
MWWKRWLVLVIAVAFIAIAVARVAPSVTFRPDLPRELTVRVLRINNVSTDSFFQYGMSHPSHLTVEVEVTWNEWQPVKGASVTIYDLQSAGKGTTNANGIATVSLPFPSPIRPFQEKRYLSLMASMGSRLMVEQDAIPIYYE